MDSSAGLKSDIVRHTQEAIAKINEVKESDFIQQLALKYLNEDHSISTENLDESVQDLERSSLLFQYSEPNNPLET